MRTKALSQHLKILKSASKNTKSASEVLGQHIKILRGHERTHSLIRARILGVARCA